MARRRLIAALAAALLVHAAVLEWLAAHRPLGTVLRPTADPMFTRLLKPQAAPTPVAPAPPSATPPRPSTHAARALPAPPREAASAAQPHPKPATDPEPAPREPAAAALPEAPAAAPASAATGTEPAAGDPASLDRWPADTRLTYRLGGQFRGGDLYGDARVQWQRQDARYQVRVDVDVTLFVAFTMTSQGEVTPDTLLPEVYEESRRGKRRSARFGSETVELEGGRFAPRPVGMQDTASQFVELSHRFATGRERLEVGRAITLWLARPGGVDAWTYDIVEREMLKTAGLGTVEAFRLVPRPITRPRGNITAEMWFSPQLQHLPVRIKLKMGDEAFLDLMVERIEQR